MADINYIEKIIIVSINLIGILLALWVYFANQKEKLNQWFVVMTASIVFWVNFSFFGFSAKDNFLATIFYRLNFTAVSLFLLSFFYFYVIYFLQQKGKYEILGKIIAALGIIFAGLSLFTNLIVKETITKDWGSEIVFGPANNFFNLYALGVASAVVALLIKRYFELPRSQKSKIEYFLIGTFLSVLFNIIFNIVFPLVTESIVCAHFGDYSAIFLLTFTAYAIVRQNLFDIKIILTALLVSFIAVLLSLDIFLFTDNITLQAFKTIGLLMFLYLSRQLIIGVMQEEERIKKMAELAKNLEETNSYLQSLIKMKTDFLHIVSHQLRTPLTAMRGFISMWDEGMFNDYPAKKMAEVKKRIVNNTERLNNLVNDMVIAMESEGGLTLAVSKVDIEKLVKNNIEVLKSNYEKKKLYLRYKNMEKNLPMIETDGKYLNNAVMNLIDNAEKYTRKGGLRIKTYRDKNDKNNIKIEFADTGVGINEKDRKNLFQKFSRGEKSSHINPNGSGLGLYIIKEIIENLGGHIEVASEGDGKGTTFTVTLPVKQPASTKIGGNASPAMGGSTKNKVTAEAQNTKSKSAPQPQSSFLEEKKDKEKQDVLAEHFEE